MISIGVPILCAVGAGLSNTLVAVTVKGAQHHDCRPSRFTAISMTAAGGMSLVVALVQTGYWFDWRLWILGIILGLLCCAAIGTTVHANRLGPPSLPWAMANLGLVVPIFLAAMLLNENLRWMDAVSLVVFVGMLLAFVRGTTHAGDVHVDHRSAFMLFLALVFLTNGILMFGFRLNSFFPPGVNKSALSVVMYATASVVSWLDELRQPHRKFLWEEIRWAVGMGVGNGTAILLLLVAVKLPATVAFPVVQGVSFLGGICATALIFHERLNRWKIAGIVLGLAVILLSVWR